MQTLTMTEIEEVSGGSLLREIFVGIASSAAYEAAAAAIGSVMQGGGDLEAATAGQLGA